MKTQTYHAEKAERLLAEAERCENAIDRGLAGEQFARDHDRYVARAHVHAILATVGRLAP